MVAIYDEIVHGKKSFFSIPNNAVGKAFVNELSSTLQNYVDSKGSDGKVLYTFAVLPVLLLQKPMPSCGYKDATQHLRRRLDLWATQDLSLLEEGRCLQKQFTLKTRGGQLRGEEDCACQFGMCMATGQVHQALRMLSEEKSDEASAGVFQMEDMVIRNDGEPVTVGRC